MIGKVRSSDGTVIAFERSGAGPPVILVGGAFNDRTTAAPLAAALAPRMTVFAYDRRGRGDSGDTAPYAVEREVDDLRALIAEAGGAAALYGLSSGAILVIEAAIQGAAITKMALFEPPYVTDGSRPAQSANLPTQLAELTSAGRSGEAVELFLTRAVGVPPDGVAQMRSTPMWPALEKMAHTLVYDTTITGDGEVPAGRLAAVTVPALVLDSTGSPPWLRASAQTLAGALPDATHRSLDGQFHDVPPPVLAPVLAEFLLR